MKLSNYICTIYIYGMKLNDIQLECLAYTIDNFRKVVSIEALYDIALDSIRKYLLQHLPTSIPWSHMTHGLI